jgi:transposase-like protein
MAIVWPCTMSAHDYAAAGRGIEVPRPSCQRCQLEMSFHGFYERPLRIGASELRLCIRRARCRACRSSHALLPDFVARARLDVVDVIGTAIEQVAAGASTAKATAGSGGVPQTTVRSWRRRFAERAGVLARGFLAAAAALGDLVPRAPRAGELALAVAAMGAAVSAARRRLSASGSDWRIANRIVGGELLAANTNPPWLLA